MERNLRHASVANLTCKSATTGYINQATMWSGLETCKISKDTSSPRRTTDSDSRPLNTCRRVVAHCTCTRRRSLFTCVAVFTLTAHNKGRTRAPTTTTSPAAQRLPAPQRHHFAHGKSSPSAVSNAFVARAHRLRPVPSCPTRCERRHPKPPPSQFAPSEGASERAQPHDDRVAICPATGGPPNVTPKPPSRTKSGILTCLYRTPRVGDLAEVQVVYLNVTAFDW